MQQDAYGQATDSEFVQTAVGAFDDADALQHALAGLSDAGFTPDDISVVTRGQDADEGEGRILVMATAKNSSMLQAALEVLKNANALSTRSYNNMADASLTAKTEGAEQAIAQQRGMPANDDLNTPANDRPLQTPAGQPETGEQSANSAAFLPPLRDYTDDSKRDIATRNTYAPDNAGQGQDPMTVPQENMPNYQDQSLETAPGTAEPLIDDYKGGNTYDERLNRFGAGSDRAQ